MVLFSVTHFTDAQIFNIAASKDNVFVHFITGWYLLRCLSILCAIRSHFMWNMINTNITQANGNYLPLDKVTVASLLSTSYKIPSYLISAFDIRLILLPMYGVPEAMVL